MNFIIFCLILLSCKPSNNVELSDNVKLQDTVFGSSDSIDISSDYRQETENTEIIDLNTEKYSTAKNTNTKTKLPRDIIEKEAVLEPDVMSEIIPVVNEVIENEIKEEVPPLDLIVELDLHKEWDTMLKKYVSSDGIVKYSEWKRSENQLDKYLTKLSENEPKNSWTKDEELAYWINVYNAFTVKLILKNYPVISITDLHNGKPWDVKWIAIGSNKYSLNNIENDIIRPKFKEPRIHFAVNCAAISCPPLANTAFTAKNLNSLLDKQTRSFINSNANSLTATKIEISKIFDWYAIDFDNIISYLNKYTQVKILPTAKMNYKYYNWKLNGK
jgi:hypothetical protein